MDELDDEAEEEYAASLADFSFRSLRSPSNFSIFSIRAWFLCVKRKIFITIFSVSPITSMIRETMLPSVSGVCDTMLEAPGMLAEDSPDNFL